MRPWQADLVSAASRACEAETGVMDDVEAKHTTSTISVPTSRRLAKIQSEHGCNPGSSLLGSSSMLDSAPAGGTAALPHRSSSATDPVNAAAKQSPGSGHGAASIALFYGDGCWYDCRIDGVTLDRRFLVTFTDYEGDGRQETEWSDVATIEPGLCRAMGKVQLGRPWTASICGELGLSCVGQLEFLTEADVESLNLPQVQHNAFLALLRDFCAGALDEGLADVTRGSVK